MLPYQLKIVSLMTISHTQLGNVQHSIETNIKKFHVIASSSIGSLLHHNFIYAELLELYLVTSKYVFIEQFNSKALKDAKVQN